MDIKYAVFIYTVSYTVSILVASKEKNIFSYENLTIAK